MIEIGNGPVDRPRSSKPAMRPNREAQEKARELRAKGRSVKEISAELGVAQSSVSIWVRDVPLSPEAQARLAQRHPRGDEHPARRQVLQRTPAEVEARRLAGLERRRNAILQEAEDMWAARRSDQQFLRQLQLYLQGCEAGKAREVVSAYASGFSEAQALAALFRSICPGRNIEVAAEVLVPHYYSRAEAQEVLNRWKRCLGSDVACSLRFYYPWTTGEELHAGACTISARDYDGRTGEKLRRLLALAYPREVSVPQGQAVPRWTPPGTTWLLYTLDQVILRLLDVPADLGMQQVITVMELAPSLADLLDHLSGPWVVIREEALAEDRRTRLCGAGKADARTLRWFDLYFEAGQPEFMPQCEIDHYLPRFNKLFLPYQGWRWKRARQSWVDEFGIAIHHRDLFMGREDSSDTPRLSWLSISRIFTLLFRGNPYLKDLDELPPGP